VIESKIIMDVLKRLSAGEYFVSIARDLCLSQYSIKRAIEKETGKSISDIKGPRPLTCKAQTAVDMVVNGATLEEAGTVVNVSKQRVWQWLKDANITPVAKKRVHQSTQQAIQLLREKKLSIREIANVTGLNYATLRKIAAKEGIELLQRDRGSAPPHPSRARAVEDMAAGMHYSEAALKYGIHITTAHRWAVGEGVIIRKLRYQLGE